MGQKHEKYREFRTPFPPRDIRKNPRSMYARVPQVMAQFVLKIEKLSHIIGTAPILEMARAYGLRPRLRLLVSIQITPTNLVFESIIQKNLNAVLCLNNLTPTQILFTRQQFSYRLSGLTCYSFCS